jgi:hypothetical protein
MITGVIGILIENRRYKNELRVKHLDSIKEKCLTSLLQRLKELHDEYSLVEQRYDVTVLRERLQDGNHWWEGFSLQGKSDKVLYRDLGNHFKTVPEKLRQTESVVSSATPLYLQGVLDLETEIVEALRNQLQTITHAEKFSSDERRTCQSLTPEERQRATFQVLRLAVSSEASEKLNASSEIRRFVNSNEKIELLKRTAYEFAGGQHVKSLQELRTRIESGINETVDAIQEAIHVVKLEGNCKYV